MGKSFNKIHFQKRKTAENNNYFNRSKSSDYQEKLSHPSFDAGK